MLPAERRVRYDGGRVEDVEIESRAALASDSVDVRVEASDCAEMESGLRGSRSTEALRFRMGDNTKTHTLNVNVEGLSVFGVPAGWERTRTCSPPGGGCLAVRRQRSIARASVLGRRPLRSGRP